MKIYCCGPLPNPKIFNPQHLRFFHQWISVFQWMGYEFTNDPNGCDLFISYEHVDESTSAKKRYLFRDECFYGQPLIYDRYFYQIQESWQYSDSIDKRSVVPFPLNDWYEQPKDPMGCIYFSTENPVYYQPIVENVFRQLETMGFHIKFFTGFESPLLSYPDMMVELAKSRFYVTPRSLEAYCLKSVMESLMQRTLIIGYDHKRVLHRIYGLSTLDSDNIQTWIPYIQWLIDNPNIIDTATDRGWQFINSRNSFEQCATIMKTYLEEDGLQ